MIRKTLLAFLASLLVTVQVGAAVHTSDVTERRQRLMDFACTVTQTDCSEIPLPHIAYAQLNWAGWGVAGMYFPGTDVILIDVDFRRNMEPHKLMSVIVHEMAHYIFDQTRGAHTSCETEAFAWHVGNSFLVYVGLEDQADYEWYRRYRCEAPGPVVQQEYLNRSYK